MRGDLGDGLMSQTKEKLGPAAGMKNVRLFRQYGLPEAIRTDNGTPFSSATAIGRLYPGHFETRRVSRNGGIRWKKGWLNVSHALLEEYLGLEEVADGVWSLYFGPLLLGRFHENQLKLHPGTLLP
jgi:hypothetical protein